MRGITYKTLICYANAFSLLVVCTTDLDCPNVDVRIFFVVKRMSLGVCDPNYNVFSGF